MSRQDRIGWAAGLVVTIAWGCQADLAHGQWGWFIGRVASYCAFAWLFHWMHP